MKNEKTNKSILEESLIDYKAIQEMMSKSSEGTIKDIISEKIKEGLKNMITEADDFEEEGEDDFGSEEGTEEGTDDINPEAGEGFEGENEPEDVNVDIDVDGEEGAEGMEPEEGDGETYVMQYYAPTLEDYERYQISHAAILQAEHKEKFKGKFTAFRSLMEEV